MNPPTSLFPPPPLGHGQPLNPAAATASSNGHAAKPHAQFEDQEDGYMGDDPKFNDPEDYKPSPEELARQAKLKRPRPYFIPPEFMMSNLPREAKEAVLDIVVPTYEELVLGAATALEKQAGVSLSYILYLELLDQFELGKQFADQCGRGALVVNEDRQKQITHYLKLVNSKQHVANFLLRLKILKGESPAGLPMPGRGGTSFGKS